MKRTLSRWNGLVLLTVAALLAAVAPNCHAEGRYVMPTYSDAVDKAVAAENLKAVASKTSDPQVLLGLAFLAQEGSPVRREISEMAVKAKPEYAPVVAVIAVSMDGINEKSAADVIACDPDNALGYYLQGNLLYQANKEKEALAALRKAAGCAELRLYESTTSEALFKALDALDLRGRDRLCALSWVAGRSFNFNIYAFQPLQSALPELARNADIATRKEISDLLLVLAGQLFTTNFCDRTFADRDLQSSFRLKAEVAFVEKSPTANGYAAVCRALISTSLNWPEIEGKRNSPLEQAQFLADRIHHAFAIADPAQRKNNHWWTNFEIPDSNKADFDKAEERAISAAKALIDVALTDPDGIMGAYLKGLPPRKPREDEIGPWVSTFTFVERLMNKRPDVYRAAAAYDEAMEGMNEVAGKYDLRMRNIGRMMDIGKGIFAYAGDHSNTFPDSLAVLFEKKYLEPPLEAKSLRTGRPYVYVAAGKKWPEKSNDIGRFILFYDDDKAYPASRDGYFCIFADGHGSATPVDKVMEQLKAQGYSIKDKAPDAPADKPNQ